MNNKHNYITAFDAARDKEMFLWARSQKRKRRRLKHPIKRPYKFGFDTTKSKEYNSWAAMKTRCLNPNTPQFYRYGGKGITVCEKWLNFDGFLSDMGNIPSDGYTLDRIDNNKGYYKGNCRWASVSTQNYNQDDRKDNTSGYKGVHLHDKKRMVWRPIINLKNKSFSLGLYKCKHKAAMVYDMFKEENNLPPYKKD